MDNAEPMNRSFFTELREELETVITDLKAEIANIETMPLPAHGNQPLETATTTQAQLELVVQSLQHTAEIATLPENIRMTLLQNQKRLREDLITHLDRLSKLQHELIHLLEYHQTVSKAERAVQQITDKTLAMTDRGTKPAEFRVRDIRLTRALLAEHPAERRRRN